MKIPDSFYNVEFSRATMFGYRTEEVDSFVETAFRLLDELQGENNKLNAALEHTKHELSKYKNDEEMLRAALVGSQKLAYEYVSNAKQQYEEILANAKSQADEIIADISYKKEEMERIYQLESKEIADFKNKVFELYTKHIGILQAIPDGVKLELLNNASIESIPEEDTVKNSPEVDNNIVEEPSSSTEKNLSNQKTVNLQQMIVNAEPNTNTPENSTQIFKFTEGENSSSWNNNIFDNDVIPSASAEQRPLDINLFAEGFFDSNKGDMI